MRQSPLGKLYEIQSGITNKIDLIVYPERVLRRVILLKNHETSMLSSKFAYFCTPLRVVACQKK